LTVSNKMKRRSGHFLEICPLLQAIDVFIRQIKDTISMSIRSKPEVSQRISN
jgi:hypothetical protein